MKREVVKFYFSFRSPYSWLAFTRIEKELAYLPVELEYMPIFPPPGSNSDRLNPPREKGRYILRDVARFAKVYGLPFKFPRSVDTDWAKPHMGFLFAQENGKGRDYALRVYGSRFSEGRDVADLDLLAAITLGCGLEKQAFLDAVKDNQYQARLESCFASAQTDGVFGVPTFIYRDEMFWGNDRIEWLVKTIERSTKGL